MQHWTQYWQSTNSLNSFAEGEQGKGYHDEVAKYWHSQFNLIAPKSKVVDLGTGNGAVALLAEQFSQTNNLDWEVLGLDAADIKPQHLKTSDLAKKKHLNNIEFVGNTPIESMTFEPNSVSAFVSQFAFEYSDIEKSLQRCLECLKPGGILSLVAHHPDSSISKDSTIGEAVLEEILVQSPAFMQADLLLDIAQQQTQSGQMHNWSQNPYRQTITETLHWVFSQLKEQFKTDNEAYWCNSTINQITNTLKQIGQINPAQLRQNLSKTYQNLDAHKLRLIDQNNACLTAKRIARIDDTVMQAGASIEKNKVVIEKEIFGLQLIIKK